MAPIPASKQGTANHNPQKQAVELVFEGLWMMVAARPPEKTSTTLVFRVVSGGGGQGEVVGVGGRLNNDISIEEKKKK